MDLSHQQIFRDLKKQIDNARSHQSHILIYSFTGSGSSYLFKFLAQHDRELTYINDVNQDLGNFSLLDLSLKDSITLLEKVNINQKCALLVNNGLDFHSPLLEKYKTHFYLSCPIVCRSESDTALFVKEINSKLSDQNIQKIYKISQGIGKIIKYLAVNHDSIDSPDDTLLSITNEVVSSLKGYYPEEIKSLGITLPIIGQGITPFPLTINFDLSFSEDNQLSSEILTPTEAKILQKIIDNDGKISKEEVSDIKWGENKYDEFSDQAINKTLRRLDSKLKKFSIKTIPKVGFVLESNAS
jgi:hypothetical protein